MKVLSVIFSKNLTFQSINPAIWNFNNYLKWMRSPNSNSFIESINQSWDKLQLIEYVNKINFSDNEILFAISDRHTLEHIGNIKFHNIDLVKKSSWVGALIGDQKYRGKGVFQESFLATSKYLKDNLGIIDFFLGVNPENISAIKSYLKTGFKVTKVTETRYEMQLNI